MELERLDTTPPWRWPEDAGDTLAAVLTDRSADGEDRRLAAELAGELVAMGEGLADALLEVLRNPEEPAELRGRAAVAFGPTLAIMDEPLLEEWEGPEDRPISGETAREIRRALAETVRDDRAPTLVRRRALEASVRASADWHREAVRAAHRSGDSSWRLTAVFCMAHLAGFGDEILEALASDDRRIRREAVRSAGRLSLHSAWPRVRHIIRRRGPGRDLFLAAVRAAGTVGPDPLVVWEELHELQDAEDEEIGNAAEDAIRTAELFGGPASGEDGPAAAGPDGRPD